MLDPSPLPPSRASSNPGLSALFQVNSANSAVATVSQRESVLPPHCPPSDLAHLMFDPAASLRALVHRPGVRLNEEGRRGCGGREPLSPSDPGKVLVVLARPVDVHAASDAAPFLIRCLCAALRTSHGLSLLDEAVVRSPCCLLAVPGQFQMLCDREHGLGFEGRRKPQVPTIGPPAIQDGIARDSLFFALWDSLFFPNREGSEAWADARSDGPSHPRHDVLVEVISKSARTFWA